MVSIFKTWFKSLDYLKIIQHVLGFSYLVMLMYSSIPGVNQFIQMCYEKNLNVENGLNNILTLLILFLATMSAVFWLYLTDISKRMAFTIFFWCLLSIFILLGFVVLAHGFTYLVTISALYFLLSFTIKYLPRFIQPKNITI